MSATGLDVFTRRCKPFTSGSTKSEVIGPDKQVTWHVLGAVLRSLRDRVPLQVAVHLGAELPLLVRGLYYDRWHASDQPERYRTLHEFLGHVTEQLGAIRPVDPRHATRAVFDMLSRHVPEGQIRKVRQALPEEVRALWSEPAQASELSGAAEGPVTAPPEQVRNIRT